MLGSRAGPANLIATPWFAAFLAAVDTLSPSMEFLGLGSFDALYAHTPPVAAHVLKASSWLGGAWPRRRRRRSKRRPERVRARSVCRRHERCAAGLQHT